MSTATPFLQFGDVIGGRYVVEEALGSGSMGLVVAARDRATGARVAMKFLHPTMLSRGEMVARFRREAVALAHTQNEHVVRVLDGGEHAGSPYLVMEHLRGHELAEEMHRRGAIGVPEAVDYLLQICEGLACVHSRGVVHRDLKPSNIFLVRGEGGEVTVKILDFGISKTPTRAGEPQLTDSGVTLGSPLYMSPEQLRNASRVDHRSDIWSLGVIFHRLLANQAPFDGNGFASLCHAILGDAPIPLRKVRPEIPVDIEQVVLRCLAKKPEARFADVHELAEAIAPFAPTKTGGTAPPVSGPEEPISSLASTLGDAPAKWSARVKAMLGFGDVTEVTGPPSGVPAGVDTGGR